MSVIDDLKARWHRAAHAMQSGVAASMSVDGRDQETEPKHLRVGVNVTMADLGSLSRLLISKGIITEEEYFRAIAEGMEAEQAHYEQELSEVTGRRVVLS